MKRKILLVIVTLIVIGILSVVGIFIFESTVNQKVAILGYHDFATAEGMTKIENTDFTMDIEYFEKQLKFLKENKFKVLTLDEFYDFYQNGKKVPYKSVVITMDDGYQSNYDLAFPLLKKYNMPATVFIVGRNMEREKENFMTRETVEKAKEEYPNITFASHSYNLHTEGMSQKDKAELENDFDNMSRTIPTEYLAYPYGSYSDTAMEVLKENNYKLAFGFGPGKNFRKASRKDNKYLIPRLNMDKDIPFWKFKMKLLLPFE